MSDVLNRLRKALAGRYTVDREIGRGGMSIVFLAQDLRNQRNVALKVMRDYTDQLRRGVEPVFDRKKFPEVDRQLERDVW